MKNETWIIKVKWKSMKEFQWMVGWKSRLISKWYKAWQIMKTKLKPGMPNDFPHWEWNGRFWICCSPTYPVHYESKRRQSLASQVESKARQLASFTSTSIFFGLWSNSIKFTLFFLNKYKNRKNLSKFCINLVSI